MLMQISEPGESQVKEACKPRVVGIDLGTTNSLVAHVQDGGPKVLGDDPIVPSVVWYAPSGGTLVGRRAQDMAVEEPGRTLASVKRLIGRGMKDVESVRGMLPYELVGDDRAVRMRVGSRELSPVEVSAEILKELKSRAEEQLGGAIEGAVITVPAYFDDAQRQATRDAGRLAGLEVMRLMAEPTAAAVAYGLDRGSKGVYAVFDLGGGTFDISILKLSRGVFEVLATNGNAALGGDDFDQRLVCWALEQANLPPLEPRDMRMLHVKAREAKETLTLHGESPFTARLSSGEFVDMTLDTETFCSITQHLVQKTLGPTRKALRDAGLEVGDVKGVVMVGGATRMPHIQRAVREFFRRDPLNNLDPDKVVALGAAMQADVLAGNKPQGEDWLLLDVIPLSLGIETMGGLVERIIPRNSTIPTARAQEFTTFKDGQTAMSIHAVQGERELVSDCRSLARFELRGIPPMVAGAARVQVTFQVDADGLLSVAAREKSTGVEASIAVKPSYGLTDSDIERMLRDSFEHARDDMQARALQESRVDGERLAGAVQAALAEDGGLLSAEERAAIEMLLGVLRHTLSGADHRAIKQASDALNRATDEFAARRMNANVRRALAGRSIEKLET